MHELTLHSICGLKACFVTLKVILELGALLKDKSFVTDVSETVLPHSLGPTHTVRQQKNAYALRYVWMQKKTNNNQTSN